MTVADDPMPGGIFPDRFCKRLSDKMQHNDPERSRMNDMKEGRQAARSRRMNAAADEPG